MWAGKRSELVGVDDEIELCDTAEEPLQVVASLLDEYDVFVANALFRRDGGDRDAGPPFGEYFVQKEEFIVASLAFEAAFSIPASNLIKDCSPGIHWVTDREFHCFLVLHARRRVKDLGVSDSIIAFI